MDFIRFLFSLRFLKHLAIATGILALLIFFTLQSLKWYTKHDNFIIVPDFRGMNIREVASAPTYSDYKFFVVDSIADPDREKGDIITQDPYPGSRVKQHRTIYMNIVSFAPEKTVVPDLKFLTLRQAQSVLEAAGLRVGTITYIPSFDQDAVQQQLFEGRIIESGTKLDKGSRIDLQVGMGSKNQVASPSELNRDSTNFME